MIVIHIIVIGILYISVGAGALMIYMGGYRK